MIIYLYYAILFLLVCSMSYIYWLCLLQQACIDQLLVEMNNLKMQHSLLSAQLLETTRLTNELSGNAQIFYLVSFVATVGVTALLCFSMYNNYCFYEHNNQLLDKAVKIVGDALNNQNIVDLNVKIEMLETKLNILIAQQESLGYLSTTLTTSSMNSLS